VSAPGTSYTRTPIVLGKVTDGSQPDA
jgi:hypothetical protein